MGGRGTSSFSSGGGRSIAPLKTKFSSGVGTKVAETSKEALGRKGKPMTLTDAYMGANPHFEASRSGAYSEYTKNCQRCIVANELRRRGYDVVANPTYEGDTKNGVKPYKRKDGKLGYKDVWTGAFRHSKTVDVGAKKNAGVAKNIEQQMKEYGNGARAVIGVNWQRGGGHVFSVENVNGHVVAVDAQTGKRSSLKKALAGSKPTDTQITRVDNLRISERVKDYVTTERY